MDFYKFGQTCAWALFEKNAVSMRTLREVGAHLRTPLEALAPKQQKKLFSLAREVGGGGVLLPTSAQYTPLHRLHQRQRRAIQTPFIRQMLQSQHRPLHHAARKHPGLLVVTPDVARSFTPRGKTLAPQTTKDIRDVATLHEQFERAVPPSRLTWQNQLFSHLSPEVLIKERNLLGRLRGPGSREIRQTLGTIREQKEYPVLREMFQEAFKDPRAAQFLQGSARVPKAMRKRYRTLVD